MVPLSKHIADNKEHFLNPFYDPTEESTTIDYIDADLVVWNKYFLRFAFSEACKHDLQAIQSKQQQQFISLADWGLPLLPSSIFRESATELKTLKLGGNHLISPPTFLLQTTALKKLILNNNHLFTLPSSLFKQLKLLEELNVENNYISYLPSFKELTKLKRVLVSKNNLRELVDLSSSIISLEIGDNPLTPAALMKLVLPQVGLLDLSSLLLTTIPTSFQSCSQLQILNLSNNKIKAFSSELKGLTQLMEFNLGNNPLEVVPEAVFGLTNLRYLYLSQCELVKISPSIQYLSKLSIVKLEDNNLNALPLEMDQLTGLKELYLSTNSFSTFPPALCRMTNLEVLSIHHNNITVIPNEISKLKELLTLDISHNRISHLPVEVCKLSLKTIRMAGNPWRFPPPEIIAHGMGFMMEYMKSLLGQDAIHHNQLNMMVIGHSKSGKTSVVKGLIEKRECTQECSTLTSHRSISITQMRENIRLHDDEKKTTLLFETWDFTSTDLLLMAHLFFRADMTLYLLCWNLELEMEDAQLEYWLEIISRRAPQAPILLVATHSDCVGKNSNKIVNKALERLSRFSDNIRSAVLVSSTKKAGFDQLWAAVESALQNESWIGESFPARFRQLNDALKREGETRAIPIITLKEVNELCESVSIPAQQNGAAMSSMIRFGTLHSLPGDNTVFVLNVGWVIGLISSLFEASKTVWLEGILKHRLLQEIWKPDVYDPKYHPRLIDLLGVRCHYTIDFIMLY